MGNDGSNSTENPNQGEVRESIESGVEPSAIDLLELSEIAEMDQSTLDVIDEMPPRPSELAEPSSPDLLEPVLAEMGQSTFDVIDEMPPRPFELAEPSTPDLLEPVLAETDQSILDMEYEMSSRPPELAGSSKLGMLGGSRPRPHELIDQPTIGASTNVDSTFKLESGYGSVDITTSGSDRFGNSPSDGQGSLNDEI
ncbi:hypothetical protein G3A49_02705 [Haloferax volcanii]|uniref:Uncharacterized protein n=1 Tax=Haloferax volcanii TaxID=2246 RepID=A0A558FRV0_HALVO|nr:MULTISPECIES: hypothetical protein [Haloferax]QIB77115.1 hypothetical protein G3A49_02705 [Haloferax alexandrinus]TVT88221.1 hypothetical protein FQA18_19035 [Haloferax volcanii]